MWGDQEIIRGDVKTRTDVFLNAGYKDVVRRALRPLAGPIAETFESFGSNDHYERHLVARYPTGGHFLLHRDNLTPATRARRLAISINLNDDYEGGKLTLPEIGVSIKAPAGAAVVFPGSTLHGVREITRGARYAYLTFIL